MSSSKETQSNEPSPNETAAPPTSHSQGLGDFLVKLSNDKSGNLNDAMLGLIGILKTEQKIGIKREEVRKDNEFADQLDGLGLKENEGVNDGKGDGKAV